MTRHDERARELFMQGYNCSQSVLCAFSDVTGMDAELSARIACSFGGGLSRLREVCGTVSGAALVLGIACGYSDPADGAAKTAHYRLVQEFARRFREAHGSIVCRELLAGVDTRPGGDPEARSAEYYKKRPCPELVRSAAQILDEMLAEMGRSMANQ